MLLHFVFKDLSCVCLYNCLFVFLILTFDVTKSYKHLNCIFYVCFFLNTSICGICILLFGRPGCDIRESITTIVVLRQVREIIMIAFCVNVADGDRSVLFHG